MLAPAKVDHGGERLEYIKNPRIMSDAMANRHVSISKAAYTSVTVDKGSMYMIVYDMHLAH